MLSLEKETQWLLQEKYNGKETAAFKRDLARLTHGEHVAYVIGFSEFLGAKIDLSARPLIPRPETEYWAEKVITELGKEPPNHGRRTTDDGRTRILDLFCGSGCIGLSVLKHIPEARVDLADIEPAYFPGIRKSARWNKIPASRMRLISSDVFKNIKDKYDLILANPPYIPASGRKVQSSVLAEEPHNALFGGKDGLKFIRAILRDGKKHLSPLGKVVIEFDPPQKRAIGELAKRYGWKIKFFRDQYGRWRWLEAEAK